MSAGNAVDAALDFYARNQRTIVGVGAVLVLLVFIGVMFGLGVVNLDKSGRKTEAGRVVF